MFLPHPRVKVSIVGSLRDREVACSASDRQDPNFEFCVWRTVSSQSSHHPQEVLLAQFSLYVHKGGLKPDSFHLWQCISNKGSNISRVVGVQYYLIFFVDSLCCWSRIYPVSSKLQRKYNDNEIHKIVCDRCSVNQNVNFHTCLFIINSHIFPHLKLQMTKMQWKQFSLSMDKYTTCMRYDCVHA